MFSSAVWFRMFYFSSCSLGFFAIVRCIYLAKDVGHGLGVWKMNFFSCCLYFNIVRLRYELSLMINIPTHSSRHHGGADLFYSLFLLYTPYFLIDISFLMFHPAYLEIIFLSISFYLLYILRDYSIIALYIKRSNESSIIIMIVLFNVCMYITISLILVYNYCVFNLPFGVN